MTAGCALYMGTLSTVPDYAGKPMATFPDILMAFFPMNLPLYRPKLEVRSFICPETIFGVGVANPVLGERRVNVLHMGKGCVRGRGWYRSKEPC